MRMWLDVSEKPADFDIQPDDFRHAARLLMTGTVRYVSFGNSFSLVDEFATGYLVACFIEAMAYTGWIPPIEYTIRDDVPLAIKLPITAAMQSAVTSWQAILLRSKTGHLAIETGLLDSDEISPPRRFPYQ